MSKVSANIKGQMRPFTPLFEPTPTKEVELWSPP